MNQFIKKENLTVITGQYLDQQGNQKNEYKTIGELVTMQGDDGQYQFFKLWGPGGVTEGKVFEQRRPNDVLQPQQTQQQQYVQQGQPMSSQQVQQQYGAQGGAPMGKR